MLKTHLQEAEAHIARAEERVAKQRGLVRRKAMEWFSQTTSIAGFQVPNWGLVLGAIIVILLIYQFMR